MKLSKFDYKMFDKARQIAQTSTYDAHNLGCVITYKGHIIAMGANSNKSHTMQKKYNKKYRKFNKSPKMILDSLHAEMACITKIPYPLLQTIDWKKAKIYVYRICKGKSLGQGMARPCESCRAAIRDLGIRKIYYTTDSGYAMEEIF